MRFEREINIYGNEVILKRFQATETSIEVVQGKISALISESELIELENSQATMYSKLASAVMDIDSLTINFSDLTTKYNTVSGQYTALDSKVAQYKASVDGLSANVSQISQNLENNYSTTTAMNAAIKASVDGLSSTVSKTYATTTQLNTAKSDAISTAKSYTDSAKSSALTTAKGYADAAENAANSNTENLLKNYSTTVQMNSAITQKANEISAEVSSLESTLYNNYSTTTSMNSTIDLKINQFSTSVSETYATKSQLNNYSTTAQMNSAINQKANEINASVSATYATKSALNTANGKIDDLEEWKSEASLKITDSAIISTVINSTSYENSVDSLIEQKADSIRLKADRISWESTYSSMTESGVLTCKSANIEGVIHSDYGDTEIYIQNGYMQIYKDGINVGNIGANQMRDNPSAKGLIFDLGTAGSYTGFSALAHGSDSYDLKLWYSHLAWDDIAFDTIYFGCPIDMNNYQLQNVSWYPEPGITATIEYVQILKMNSDGTVSRWGDNGLMRFRNGILVELTYYSK